LTVALCYVTPNVTMINWGYTIKRLMDERGMTHLELAEAVGMSRPNVTQIVNGRNKSPSEKNLKAFSKAFGMTVEQLTSEIYGGQLKYGQPIMRIPKPDNIKGELYEDESTAMVELPLMGTIPAGAPEVEEEDIQKVYIPFPAILVKGASKRVYLLKIGGDSLSGDGINKNDLVAVDPEAPIIEGKIYAVRVGGGEVVARHMKRLDGKVRLTSSDGIHEEIELSGVEVMGRIIGSAKIKRH